MKWPEFAVKIGAKYLGDSESFVVGDNLVEVITKERDSEKLTIQKITRRSIGAASYSKFEKFEIAYLIKNVNLRKIRITRKSIFQRSGKDLENHYKIEGDRSIELNDIIQSKELKYLLKHPKSEFIILSNSIKFKSEWMGKLTEELEIIYLSFKTLKNKVVKEIMDN